MFVVIVNMDIVGLRKVTEPLIFLGSSELLYLINLIPVALVLFYLSDSLLATRFSGNFWSQTSSHWILPRGSQRPECFLTISKSSSRKPSTAQAFKSRWESYFIYMPNNPTPFHLNILLPNTIISSLDRRFLRSSMRRSEWRFFLKRILIIGN